MKKYYLSIVMSIGFSLSLVWAAPTPETPMQVYIHHLLGHGLPTGNPEQAVYQLLALAKQGDSLAQNEVAYLYLSGQYVEQDLEKAFRYFQKAADHHLSSAQYNLGLLYLYGIGHTPDKQQACRWFKKSARAAFEPAQDAHTHYCE